MKTKLILAVLTTLLIILSGCNSQNSSNDAIKIGVITDLTGPVAYWGESTRVGTELAVEELKQEGYNVQLVFEDYQLDASKALSSAQKLVNIDSVDAIYAEFNPAAISVSSFLKDKDILFVYVAAVRSPLKDSELVYKTYLDYREGCKQVAQKFKDEGITKIGMLKLNLEIGEICLTGVKEVYGENVAVESYNLGDSDFRTQILKLGNKKVEAIVNIGFEDNTLNALKVIKEQNLNIRYGTVDDTISQNVMDKYGDQLKGTVSFGFKDLPQNFKQKLVQEDLSTDYGAAFAYIHIKQMVRSLAECKKDKECVIKKMDQSKTDSTIGFNGFTEHIAGIDMEIKSY